MAVVLQRSILRRLPSLNRVTSVVDFEADVLDGNWVTMGFDSLWSV